MQFSQCQYAWQAARDALAAMHGEPEVAKHFQRSILDSLVSEQFLEKVDHKVRALCTRLGRFTAQVRTILSQNTTDATSQRAYTALKEGFPTWEAVHEAQPGKSLTLSSVSKSAKLVHL